MRGIAPWEDGRNLEREPEPDAEAPRPRSTRGGRVLGFLALLALVAFHAAQMASWIRREGRPASWDQAVHLQISLECRNAILSGHWRDLLHFKPKPGMPPFPPLYHLSILYAHKSSDPVRAALWANCFYMGLLCLSLWGLGRHFGGDWAGFSAAALFSCAPETQWLFFNQLVDLAVVAWVAAAYWALVASAGFMRRIPSLLFGLAFAAGMLTKWSAFAYFLPAFWLSGSALNNVLRRWNAAAAWALAAALCAPWYLAQGAVLLPRLVEASSDKAVAVWQGGAVFIYLIQMIVGLGTPLWVLGLISVCVPSTEKNREDVMIPEGWFLGSYLFWMLVPNRQLRYLLPGLPPLAVMSSSLWPGRLLAGLVAYQLAAAANYSHGWIPHWGPSLVLPTSFMRSELPAREDWKIAEILKEAARRHQPDDPEGNLSLVANHPYFNGPNFNYVAAQLGLNSIHIRGVNRRYCEFAEFVVVKEGSLGSPDVVGQLPEVQRFMLEEKDNWFAAAYREVGRWPLPDKTDAVLFMRVKLVRAPLGERRVHYDYFEDAGFTAEDLSIELGRWDSAQGVYPLARVRAGKVALRGLEIRDVAMEMEGLALMPVHPGRSASGQAKEPMLDFRFLRLKRLRLASAAVNEAAAAAFFKARVPGTEAARFRLDKTVAAWVSVRHLRLAAEAAVSLAEDKRSLTLEVRKAALLGVPIPAAVLGPLARYTVEFHPNPELPFEIEIPGLMIEKGELKVAGPR